MKTILLLLPTLALLSACTTSAPSATTEPSAEAPSAPVTTMPPDQVAEAALAGNMNIIDQALASGFEVDLRDDQGRTLLMYASFNGHAAVAQKLLAAGADVNAQDQTGSTALMFAASGPFPKTVKLLIDQGAEVNTADNNEHWTALMWAAAEGQAENTRILLEHKANPALKEIDGDTAESFATQKGHTAVVQILRQAVAEGE